MADGLHLGSKIRAIRRANKLTQTRLAENLSISASYLNLIEHNRRPLPARLLLQLARMFDLDLASFAEDNTAQLKTELMEVFGDRLFDEHGITKADVDDLVEHHPNLAGAIRTLYEAWGAQREQHRALAGAHGAEEVVGRSILPSEEVADLIQQNGNHFPALEAAAETLIRDAALRPNHVQEGLVAHLEGALGYRVIFARPDALGGAVRRIDRANRVLEISEILPPRSRNFQLAHSVGLLASSDVLDAITIDPCLSRAESKRLARVALANYFAGAVLMPYEALLQAAEEDRYDIELLGHRFRVSFEQVCHRLTTLRRPGREGVRFHLIRIDIAGNISKRFSSSGIQFARYSGACPRWNVFQALLTPGVISTQHSVMPNGDAFFCVARAMRKGERGYHTTHTVHAVGLGCRVEDAAKLVYADSIDLARTHQAVPIGVTCRLCERTDCEQRAMPSVGSPMHVNEDLRGVSFYAGVPDPS
jgi:predicted transcriptional regulator/transcriptional regulator with XRE-family HTH domain